jgi:hypothetical protein
MERKEEEKNLERVEGRLYFMGGAGGPCAASDCARLLM